jgi:hypothetical protein
MAHIRRKETEIEARLKLAFKEWAFKAKLETCQQQISCCLAELTKEKNVSEADEDNQM